MIISLFSRLIQEYVISLIIPWVSLTFPLFTIFLVPALRVTAWQIIVCTAWKANEDNGDSDINGNTAANTRSRGDEKEDGNVGITLVDKTFHIFQFSAKCGPDEGSQRHGKINSLLG